VPPESNTTSTDGVWSGNECLQHRLNRVEIVRSDPGRHRFAPEFRHSVEQHRLIRIEDLPEREETSRSHDLVTRGDHGDSRPGDHFDMVDSDGRHHSGIPGRQSDTAAEHRISATDVRTGI